MTTGPTWGCMAEISRDFPPEFLPRLADQIVRRECTNQGFVYPAENVRYEVAEPVFPYYSVENEDGEWVDRPTLPVLRVTFSARDAGP